MEDEFLKAISKNLILDSTREKFARETFKTLLNLKNEIYKNQTGYQRLLLGRKGVGKTVVLEEIQKTAKDLLGDDLITIYHEYLSTDKITKPSYLIADVLKNDTLKEDIKLCEKELKYKKKFVFIVLDEIQNLYLKNDNGKQVINQISEIGGSREGCIHSIITGSSYHLR
jgi:Cdc6-like AAA superfamily ATPase